MPDVQSSTNLPPFWIRHSMDLDAVADHNICHVLGRDEDVLLLVRHSSRLDQHLHTDATVHSIHEDVKLVWIKDR